MQTCEEEPLIPLGQEEEEMQMAEEQKFSWEEQRMEEEGKRK